MKKSIYFNKYKWSPGIVLLSLWPLLIGFFIGYTFGYKFIAIPIGSIIGFIFYDKLQNKGHINIDNNKIIFLENNKEQAISFSEIDKPYCVLQEQCFYTKIPHNYNMFTHCGIAKKLICIKKKNESFESVCFEYRSFVWQILMESWASNNNV